MFKFACAALVIFSLTACAAPREPRKCPLGAMVQIEAPERIAMQTATQATAKYGYTDFTVVNEEGDGENYKMLIKMSDGPGKLAFANLR